MTLTLPLQSTKNNVLNQLEQIKTLRERTKQDVPQHILLTCTLATRKRLQTGWEAGSAVWRGCFDTMAHMVLFRHIDKQGAVKVVEKLSVGSKSGYSQGDSRSYIPTFMTRLIGRTEHSATSHVLWGSVNRSWSGIWSPVLTKVFFVMWSYCWKIGRSLSALSHNVHFLSVKKES